MSVYEDMANDAGEYYSTGRNFQLSSIFENDQRRSFIETDMMEEAWEDHCRQEAEYWDYIYWDCGQMWK
jgi:hypothetical protein